MFRVFLILLFVVLLLGCENPREVEGIYPRTGTIFESFLEPARTQLSQTYPISMPVDGKIGRIPLKPGDIVLNGQILVPLDAVLYEQKVEEAQASVKELEASIRLNEYDEIEKTLEFEIHAMIQAFGEMLKASEAQVEAEKARSDRADNELTRIRKLFAEQKVSQSELEDVELQAETTLIELRRQEFYLAATKTMMTIVKLGPTYLQQWLTRKRLEREVLLEQRAQAKARLARAQYEFSLAKITSPIDGIVLEKYEEGAHTFPTGHALLLLGKLDDLEIVAEVLTQDALKLAIGAEVQIEIATEEKPFLAIVTRIEPAGFTKLSSLGVEQQRVKVLLKLKDFPKNLGVGYRLQARFITKFKQETLIVPRYSVLQEANQEFYVFKIQDNKLFRQPVKVGLRSDLEIEIIEGISPKDLLLKTVDATIKSEESVKILSISNKK